MVNGDCGSVSSIAAQTLGVFSHTAEAERGDRLSVEGKVVQRAECCPNNSSLYANIKKEALTKELPLNHRLSA